jgi:hypothetical protein
MRFSEISPLPTRLVLDTNVFIKKWRLPDLVTMKPTVDPINTNAE